MSDPLLDRLTLAVGTHYLIEGEVGRGGMGVVYRALDLRLNRHVAIKVLPPELAFNPDVRTRFLREAQTAASLTHPHIVPIYSVGEGQGLVWFVMALVEGESLAARLAHTGQQPVTEVQRILADVAEALAYAHRHGVIHRDVKPENILVDRASGRVFVTDFGIARAAEGDSRLTVTGVAVGTPAYMSPEQAMGERDVDGRSDVYSLAVVGYHMLAGRTPFKAANTPAMLVKHVSEVPRPIRELRPDAPRGLAAAIDRALAKRPDDRFADADAFRRALGAESTAAPLHEEPPPHAHYGGYRDDAPPAEVLVGYPDAPGRGRHGYPVPPLPQLPPLHRPVPIPPPMDPRGPLGRRRDRVDPLDYDRAPLDARVSRFRYAVVRSAFLGPALLAVNAATGGFPWVLFAWGWMAVDVVRRGTSIWADGVGPLDAFRKGSRQRIAAEERRREVEQGVVRRDEPPRDQAASLVAPDVLAGPFGAPVRAAVADRTAIRDIVAALGPVERELVPDVGPAVDGLVARTASLATTLHRLAADVSAATLADLDARIAAARRAGGDDDRRATLLERQRATMADLAERRRALESQMESATLALRNLRLDLVKLRSAGVDAVLGDATSATQEARALSRDIAHAVEAAEAVRKL